MSEKDAPREQNRGRGHRGRGHRGRGHRGGRGGSYRGRGRGRGKQDANNANNANNANDDPHKKKGDDLERQKLRKEEERLAEEKRKEEEEEKTRQEEKRLAEEAVKNYIEELRLATSRVNQAIQTKQNIRSERLKNASIDRSGIDLSMLDSSVKKNTALIKKLRQISEESKSGILQDIKKVNQNKYVSEVAAAIGEVNFKQKDVQAVSQVCSLLHERYPEFTSSLLPALQKLMEPSEKTTLARKRNTLRLLLELYMVGVHPKLDLIYAITAKLVKLELAGDCDSVLSSLALISTFAKYGKEEILGINVAIVPASPEPDEKEVELSAIDKNEIISMKSKFDDAQDHLQEERSKDQIITSNQRAKFCELVHKACEVGIDFFFQHCKDLQKMESDNQKIIDFKGELSEEQIAAYDASRKNFDSLQKSVQTLCESLDKVMPPLPKENATKMSTTEDGNVVIAKGFAADVSNEGHAFDDDETRSFYEDLPNLRAQLPDVLLSKEGANAETDENKDEAANGDTQEKGETNTAPNNEPDQIRPDQQLELESLLSQLQNAVNKDAADKLSLEFCYLNSKGVRKKIIRSLYQCPRQHLEFLPYYGRITANLNQVHADIGSGVCKLLEEEFDKVMAKKSQFNVETRVRNVRFLGELTKFRVLPFASIFSIIKTLLDDFTHHSIDTLAALLETTGRFLYKRPETSIRMNNMLDVMMRLKNAKNLDPRQTTLIENAYYASRPPERDVLKEESPPLHQYIDYLIHAKLSLTTISHVVRQCRKLPLKENYDYFLHALLDVNNIKVSCIPALAALMRNLSSYHDYVVVDFVDAILEEIQLGLEQDDFTQHQQRVTLMILLGELYKNRVVNLDIIFATLYMVLFNMRQDQRKQGISGAFFRLRLVVVLLSTLGKSLNRRHSVKNLDIFLLYLQQYTLTLGSTPPDLSYDIQEMFQACRPKMFLSKSIEEMTSLIQAVQREDPNNILKFVLNWSKENEANLKVDESAEGLDIDTQGDLDNVSESDMEGQSDTGETDEESLSEEEVDLDAMEQDGMHEDELASVSSSSSFVSDSEEDGDAESQISEEDEVISFKRNLDHLKPSQEEEENLEREFQMMMQDSLNAAKLAPKASNVNLPAANKSVVNKTRQSSHDVQDCSNPQPDQSLIQFHVMFKKGAKSTVRDIQVPRTAGIAQTNKSREVAEALERSEIKRLVLQANTRDEEKGQGQVYKKVERW